MPTGPQGSATTNMIPVTTDSITVQRSQRPGLPMGKWIQPTVLKSSITPIPGPNSWKILPDSDQLGPSTRRTTSLPTKVRSAPTAIPTKATIPSALARYRLNRSGS